MGKYKNIKDSNGREWSHSEIVEYYKRNHVSPLLISFQNKLKTEIKEFEKNTGIAVVISPILVWGQAYQEGVKLILKDSGRLD